MCCALKRVQKTTSTRTSRRFLKVSNSCSTCCQGQTRRIHKAERTYASRQHLRKTGWQKCGSLKMFYIHHEHSPNVCCWLHLHPNPWSSNHSRQHCNDLCRNPLSSKTQAKKADELNITFFEWDLTRVKSSKPLRILWFLELGFLISFCALSVLYFLRSTQHEALKKDLPSSNSLITNIHA